MAVGRHDDHSGIYDACLRHDLMAHAAIGIKVEAQIVFLCKFPHFLVIGRALYIGTGSIMIKYKCRSFIVPDLFSAHFVK